MDLICLSLLHIFLIHLCIAYNTEDTIIYLQSHCTNVSHHDLKLNNNGEHSAGLLRLSETVPYEPGLNCSIRLSVDHGYQLFMTFSNVSLRNASLDNLTVVFNNKESEVVLANQQVCSNEDCEGLKFESGGSGVIILHFLSANISVPKNVSGFNAAYTVYSIADRKSGSCKGSERFLCENTHCVWSELVCDGHNNCEDRSDETKCVVAVYDTVWAIMVIVIACFAIAIFVPLFCFLAVYGTQSVVKSVMLSTEATPLLPPLDCGETSNLLTSSEAACQDWPGTSYEQGHSVNYGTCPPSSAECESKPTLHRSLSDCKDPDQTKPL